MARSIKERQHDIEMVVRTLRALNSEITPLQVESIHAEFGVDAPAILDAVKDLVQPGPARDPSLDQDDERQLAFVGHSKSDDVPEGSGYDTGTDD